MPIITDYRTNVDASKTFNYIGYIDTTEDTYTLPFTANKVTIRNSGSNTIQITSVSPAVNIAPFDVYTLENVSFVKLKTSSGASTVQITGFKQALNEDDEEAEFDERGVNVKKFGAKGDGITDDTAAIQSALDLGGSICIPEGTYLISSTLIIKKNNTHIIGIGLPVFLWNGAVSGIPLKLDKVTYNGNIDYANIQIKNLNINGNNKTLWTLWMKGFTSRCKLQNVYLTNTVGFLYNEDCYYSSYEHLYCWGQYDGLPAGMALADWQSVHNNLVAAPISFVTANTVSIKNFHCARLGTSVIPGGGTKTKQYVYMTGHNISVDDISFEKSRGYESTTVASSFLFTFDYGSNIKLENMYLENIHTDFIGQIGDYFMDMLSFKKIYAAVSTINTRCFSLLKAISFELKGIVLNNVKLQAANPVIVNSTDTFANYSIKHINVHEGSVVNVGGKNYSDGGVGQLGMTCGVTWATMNRIPKIQSGLTVTNGSDGTGHYVLVEPGALYDGNGEIVHFGHQTFSPNVAKVGWLLRPTVTATTWNVCVDTFGCVFLENTGSARTNVNRGKVILATFTTDGAGAISGLATINNTYTGQYINGTTNRRVFTTAAPSTDTWAVGDEAINTAPTASGYRGWVCTVAGTPGTWKGFGTIQA